MGLFRARDRTQGLVPTGEHSTSDLQPNLEFVKLVLSGSIVKKVHRLRERLCSVAIESSVMLISAKSTHL